MAKANKPIEDKVTNNERHGSEERDKVKHAIEHSNRTIPDTRTEMEKKIDEANNKRRQ